MRLLLMKQTQSFISTYSADVFGVCSALFELGGMTVMHDASGCNSTYNTHDEPRWYDHDSMVFLSGLSEMEAIMGDDEKLIGDILEAAEQLHPRFIAVAGTPIPMMTGCDLPAVARAVENETGIPSFGFNTNGMQSYVWGAGEALLAYAKRMLPKEAVKQPRTVNILGATPLDFSVNGTVEAIRALLTENGWTVSGCWAMGSTPEELERAGEASVNLVVSSVGMKLARYLKKTFGTPFAAGCPIGERAGNRLLDLLRESEASGEDRSLFADYQPSADAPMVAIGESILTRSLAWAIHETYGREVRVISPVDVPAGILSPGDCSPEDEEDIAADRCTAHLPGCQELHLQRTLQGCDRRNPLLERPVCRQVSQRQALRTC